MDRDAFVQGRGTLHVVNRVSEPVFSLLGPATAVLHGTSQGVSLGVRAGAMNAEATSSDPALGPHVGFCTGQSGLVELDVEARGLGLSWLFFLFQMGPARPEGP